MRPCSHQDPGDNTFPRDTGSQGPPWGSRYPWYRQSRRSQSSPEETLGPLLLKLLVSIQCQRLRGTWLLEREVDLDLPADRAGGQEEQRQRQPDQAHRAKWTISGQQWTVGSCNLNLIDCQNDILRELM